MAKLYKLTDSWGKTWGPTQWGPGVTHSSTGEGELCGPGFIHAYEHPLIAVLMNPIHAGFESPRLWVSEGEIAIRDGQLKCGCVTLTTVREILLPVVTTEMRVRVAILSAKCVLKCRVWNAWADRWLSGEDRTQAAAEKVKEEGAAWRWTAKAGLRAAQAAAAADVAKVEWVAKEAKKAAAYAAAAAVEWAAAAANAAAAKGTAAAELDLAGWLDAHGADVRELLNKLNVFVT